MNKLIIVICFTLTLTLPTYSQILADQWDPTDDTRSGATQLSEPSNNEQSHGPHTLTESDQADWFAVQLAAGVTYRFSSTGDADTVGELYAPGGVLRLTRNEGTFDNPNFEIIYTPENSGLFFVQVNLVDAGSLPGPGGLPVSTSGTYHLVYQSGDITIPPRDEWDPEDDVFEGSTELETPGDEEMIHGPHSLADLDIVDWFSFLLEEGSTYRFWSGGDARILGEIYESDGKTLVVGADSPSSGDQFSLVFTPLDTNRYLLKLSHWGSGAHEYTLHTQLLNGPAEPIRDQWDPMDDEPEGANDLGVPTPAFQTHGVHTLSLVDTLDLFRFELQAGTRYEFSSTGEMDTFAFVFGPQGERLIEQDDGGVRDNFRIVFTPEISGTYILNVRAFNVGTTGSYTLKYREVINLEGLDPWDPNDDKASGATVLPPIGIEDDSHGPHSLSPEDQFDWFQIQLLAGVEYEFTTTGNADTIGELITGDNSQIIASDDDMGDGRNFRLRTSVTISGNFFLRVRSNNNDGGVYTLSFRSNAEPEGSTPNVIANFPLNAQNEFVELPGGFESFPPGQVTLGAIPVQEGYSDGQGAIITTLTGRVETLIFNSVPTSDGPVLLQASVQALGEGASVTLGALDAANDGSISTDFLQNSVVLKEGYHRMVTLYDPAANSVAPVFQVANVSGIESATVYLDNLKILRLAKGKTTTGALLSREGENQDLSSVQHPVPIQVSQFNTRFGFIRQPGGFLEAKPGFLLWGPYPEEIFGALTNEETSLTDRTGLTFTIEPDTVELIMLPEIQTGSHPTLVRASVKANAEGASVALGILDGVGDGSLGLNLSMNSNIFTNKLQRIVTLYNPIGDTAIPLFQVANTGNNKEVQVYIDNIEVYSIAPDFRFPNEFLAGE